LFFILFSIVYSKLALYHPPHTDVDLSVCRLYSAIAHAEDLIDAIVNPAVLMTQEFQCLKSYITLIRALLSATLPDDTALGLRQSLEGLPVHAWKSIGNEFELNQQRHSDILELAANTVCSLMQNEVVHMRYTILTSQACYSLITPL
jgi:hypothetical protein